MVRFYAYKCRIISALGALLAGFVQQLLKLPAVGGDQFFFRLTALDFHRHVIVVGTDEAAASFKVGDLHDLRFGQMQDGLDAPGLLVLQVQQDLGLGVVDDALAVLAVSNAKKSLMSWVAQMAEPP